jgi:hypothetical protein
MQLVCTGVEQRFAGRSAARDNSAKMSDTFDIGRLVMPDHPFC